MATFHALKIKEITQNTPSSVTLSFDLPEELKNSFVFDAGQYITIKKELNGTELRRAYSISSTQKSGDLKVGVKKVIDGTFSKYANTDLKVGDVLDVHTPEGSFTMQARPSEKRTIAAFAAGSGITPIMSIMKTLLEEETESTFVLVYGNKNREETMFNDEISSLINTYPERLSVYFIYSQEQSSDSLFGRIEKSTVNYVIKNKHKDQNFDSFYLCGPEEMIHTVKDTLLENNVSDNVIKFELFTSSSEEKTIEGIADSSTKISVLVDGEETSFTADTSKSILDAVLEQKIDAPYSCQGGICSSCIARVTEGKVEMVKNQILTDSEVAEGLVLTCQSHAVTSNVAIDYDDV